MTEVKKEQGHKEKELEKDNFIPSPLFCSRFRLVIPQLEKIVPSAYLRGPGAEAD